MSCIEDSDELCPINTLDSAFLQNFKTFLHLIRLKCFSQTEIYCRNNFIEMSLFFSTYISYFAGQ